MISRLPRRSIIIIAVIVLLLVVARICLPYVVKHYLNGKMDRMGDYHGHLADVDLHIWRGAYSIDKLTITKVSGKVPVPLLDVGRTDISLSWHALFRGKVRGKLIFSNASLNFVDGSGKSGDQAGKGVDWREKLKLFAPVQLDRVEIRNSQITFQNFVSSPKVDLKMTDVSATATNLSNVEKRGGAQVAEMHATAKVLGDADLAAKARFDPLEKAGDFKVDLTIKKIDLTEMNSLARAYSGLDFASGKGDFVLQIEARDGQLNGYAKPLFKNLKIFSWKQDVKKDKKNPLQLAWEAAAQGITSLFKNHEKDQFATKVPINGRIDDNKVGTFKAVVNVLRNAFVKAYTPNLENLKPAPDKDGS